VVGGVVQAITGLDGKTYTRQQLDALQRNGLRIRGYVWGFRGASGNPRSMLGRLAMFDGFPIENLWYDLEEAGLSVADVDSDLVLCDAYRSDLVGIYSAYWYFYQQGWLRLTRWSDRRLWEALFNLDPTLNAGFVPYGGWTQPFAHQFDAHWRGVPGRELDISAML
jgi:hypothetical protein